MILKEKKIIAMETENIKLSFTFVSILFSFFIFYFMIIFILFFKLNKFNLFI